MLANKNDTDIWHFSDAVAEYIIGQSPSEWVMLRDQQISWADENCADNTS